MGCTTTVFTTSGSQQTARQPRVARGIVVGLLTPPLRRLLTLQRLEHFRIVRVYRLMKEYGGARMIKEFFSNRGGSALLTLFFIMILILEFGGLGIFWVESQVPDANITTEHPCINPRRMQDASRIPRRQTCGTRQKGRVPKSTV